MTGITLTEALARVLQSTAANEGRDAQCVFSNTPERPWRLDALVLQAPMMNAGPVTLRRTVRNWTIHNEAGDEIVRSHPWDDTPNVAKLGTRPDPAHIESLIQFSSRVQELANEAERLRQFVIAQNLWATVAVINRYTGQPIENAIREERRLAGVVAALVTRPPRA